MKRLLSLRLTILLILIQLLMGFLLPSYRYVMIIYLFTFFAGLSLHPLITPSFLRIQFAYFITIPIYGLIVISILGAYFISFDVNITVLPPVLLSVSCILLLIQLILGRRSFVSLFTGLKEDFISALQSYTFVIMPVILLMLLPVLLIEYPTSAFRIGPDMALYAKTTQYFLDGGTWTEAGQRANEYVGMTAGEINRYSDATMSWPVMYYFRWGLTAYQACVAVVTFTNHAFETAFISLIVPYLLVAGFVLIWLNKQFNLGVTASVLGAIAFAFNANGLNLWFEGFYGNSFALVFFVPIIYIFIYHRTTDNISRQDLIKSFGLIALLLAASLCSYAEGVIFVLTIFIVFIFIFDFIFYKGVIKWSSYFMLATAGVIGLLIILPCDFFLDWLSISFKQITEESGNGYNQPYLAWPSEILGFQNIYFNTSVDLVNLVLKRSWINIFFALTTSAVVYYLITKYFKKNESVWNILFGASIVMVALSAWFVIYKTPLNNYGYMKMYIFHLPFLFILFWGSLSLFVKDHAKFGETYKTSVYIVVFIPIVLSGLTYVLQFKDGEKLVEKKIFALHEKVKKLNLSKIVLYPSLTSERTQLELYNKIIFPSVLPAIWMIPNKWTERCLTNFKDYKVYLFIEKREDLEFPNLTENIVHEDDFYLIIDSGYKVEDGVNRESGSLDPRMFINELNAQLWVSKEAHNLKMGLPIDFSPTAYLRLHPGLQEFWISKGIEEKGKALMNRAAEIHYRDFGSKEKLEYKRPEQGAHDLLVFEK